MEVIWGFTKKGPRSATPLGLYEKGSPLWRSSGALRKRVPALLLLFSSESMWSDVKILLLLLCCIGASLNKGCQADLSATPIFSERRLSSLLEVYPEPKLLRNQSYIQSPVSERALSEGSLSEGCQASSRYIQSSKRLCNWIPRGESSLFIKSSFRLICQQTFQLFLKFLKFDLSLPQNIISSDYFVRCFLFGGLYTTDYPQQFLIW